MDGEVLPAVAAVAEPVDSARRPPWRLDAASMGGYVEGSQFQHGIAGVQPVIEQLRQLADALEAGEAIPQSVETVQRAAVEAWTEHRLTIVYCRKR